MYKIVSHQICECAQGGECYQVDYFPSTGHVNVIDMADGCCVAVGTRDELPACGVKLRGKIAAWLNERPSKT